MSHDPETLVLLRRWHSGDGEAIEQLMARHLPWIRQQVRSRMGDVLGARADADDVVQQAMVDVLRHGPRFTVDDVEHYRALLLRIVENTIRKQVRDAWRAKRDARRERDLPGSQSVVQLQADVTQPSAAADRNEQRAWVRLALELLAAEDREIVLLRQWDGLEFADIGERLGVAPDAARMRFQRAVGRLAQTLKRLRSGELGRLLGGA